MTSRPKATKRIPTYLLNDDVELAGATLQCREEPATSHLHIGTKADVESEIPDEGNAGHSTVLGVDLGVKQTAVTSPMVF